MKKASRHCLRPPGLSSRERGLLNLGFAAQLGLIGRQRLFTHHLLEFFANLIQRWELDRTNVHHFDDVPAEL